MNRTAFAKELVRIAKELMALEFDTKEEMEQYKKDHDVRPGTKLEVKKDDGNKRQEAPVKKTESDSMPSDEGGYIPGEGTLYDELDEKESIRVYDEFKDVANLSPKAVTKATKRISLALGARKLDKFYCIFEDDGTWKAAVSRGYRGATVGAYGTFKKGSRGAVVKAVLADIKKAKSKGFKDDDLQVS